jgi:hypothetical protein
MGRNRKHPYLPHRQKRKLKVDPLPPLNDPIHLPLLEIKFLPSIPTTHISSVGEYGSFLE